MVFKLFIYIGNGGGCLECPLPSNFFSKYKGYHSSFIRREIHKAWGMNNRVLYSKLQSHLRNHGHLSVETIRSDDWPGAFRFAEEWNRYAGNKKDRAQLDQEIKQGLWQLQMGTIQMDESTWLTLASLAFKKDVEKESPNHFFLKELFKLYIDRTTCGYKVREEVNQKLYGDPVRIDVLVKTKDEQIVGEMGGVQIWKVIALLYKGYKVFVFPHWTRQKNNPFIRRKLEYQFYMFTKGDSHVT